MEWLINRHARIDQRVWRWIMREGATNAAADLRVSINVEFERSEGAAFTTSTDRFGRPGVISLSPPAIMFVETMSWSDDGTRSTVSSPLYRNAYINLRHTPERVAAAEDFIWQLKVKAFIQDVGAGAIAGCLLTAVSLSAVALAGRTRARRRMRKGLCRSCGYDLRGPPGRCPECGRDSPGARPMPEPTCAP